MLVGIICVYIKKPEQIFPLKHLKKHEKSMGDVSHKGFHKGKKVCLFSRNILRKKSQIWTKKYMWQARSSGQMLIKFWRKWGPFEIFETKV